MKKGHKGNFLGDGMNDLYLECSGYVTIYIYQSFVDYILKLSEFYCLQIIVQ